MDSIYVPTFEESIHPPGCHCNCGSFCEYVEAWNSRALRSQWYWSQCTHRYRSKKAVILNVILIMRQSVNLRIYVYKSKISKNKTEVIYDPSTFFQIILWCYQLEIKDTTLRGRVCGGTIEEQRVNNFDLSVFRLVRTDVFVFGFFVLLVSLLFRPHKLLLLFYYLIFVNDSVPND